MKSRYRISEVTKGDDSKCYLIEELSRSIGGRPDYDPIKSFATFEEAKTELDKRIKNNVVSVKIVYES